ncbi:MAG: glycerol-3-phosphate cytidylyltransferase, partial [Paracoccaceae bacterium]
IQRLQLLGDRLIVAVSTDEFNLQKGKQVLIPFEQRAEIVAAIAGVDMVIPEASWEQKKFDIDTYNVDVFAMGDDWQGHFDSLREYCEVVYLERTEGVSTTQLKASLGKVLSVPRDEILRALEVLEMLYEDLG